MTTPQTHVSTAHTEGEDDRGVDTREWRRMAIGLIVGLVLAALVLACGVFAILLRIAPAPEPVTTSYRELT